MTAVAYIYRARGRSQFLAGSTEGLGQEIRGEEEIEKYRINIQGISKLIALISIWLFSDYYRYSPEMQMVQA